MLTVYIAYFRLWGGLLLSTLLCTGLAAQYQVSTLDLTPPYLPQRMDRLSYTSDGFYWVGGAKGLFRINGEAAEQMIIRDGNGIIDRDNIIQSEMIEDSRGKLWFSTFSALYCYDPVTNRMSSHPIEANGLLLDREYRPFYFNVEQDELWLRAGDRLWAYNVTTGYHRPITEESTATQYTVMPLPNGDYRITGARWILSGLELMEISPGRPPAKIIEVAPEEKAICALQLSVDSIAIGTKDGLKLVNLSRDSFVAEYFTDEAKKDDITNIKLSSHGELMVVHATNGLSIISPYSGKMVNHFDLKNGDKESPSDQLLQGAGGQMLLTRLNSGIQVLRREVKAFQNLASPKIGSINNMVNDGQNTPFLLTENGHLWQRTVSGKWIDLFQNLPNEELPKTGAIALTNDSIFVMGGPNFWVFTNGKKQRFDKPNTILDRILAHPGGARLLVTEQGLRIFSFQNGKINLTQHPKIKPPDNAFFNRFHSLSDSSFLLNLQPSQLWKISMSHSVYEIREKITGIGEIYCATKHKSGAIYAGGSQGLFRLENGRGLAVPLKIGPLATSQIQTLGKDDQGNLWLGTTDGLLAWNPKTKETRYFSEADGLPSARFTDVAPITLPNGEIWMATDAGVVAFQPEELLKRKHHRDPYIAKIWTNEEPLQSDTSSHYLKRLELNYLRNTLKFKVAAKGFGRSAASGIRYQMLGYEDKPAYTDFNTTIRYPNLPPGDYTLQLTAINQNGLPSGVRELAVIIRPPFTQTLTFKLLAGLGLILLVGGGYAILLRRERQRQQRIQEQQARLAAERDRIAGEVHDDLGGQLSSIMYLSEELLLTEAAPGTERELNRINELSRNSLQNVRDIIFALDNRRGSIADLGEQLRGTGQEFFGDRNLTFEYEEELEQPDYILSSRQKRNLLLITKEAWHNTVKHADATKVQLQFKQSGAGLQLLIRDDGKGFDSPEPNSSTGGYGLDNMQEKATSLGGQIRIESAVGKGTSLTINTPLKPGT